ncbi:type IV secretory system conjugative DNA transfer family protein [Nocardioides sp. W3-2-3]|nr:type IV secretory system conjugative DNA transfer family protein [Nocardioides convexus]NHA02142.1 type IV secretory system conjugative DNA transfer family protein [Nocardioides convexus]
MGKTARYVVPTVLRWKGAAVVTSVKADATALTIAQRRKEGPVWVFDPTGATPFPTCQWPILEDSRTYPGALKSAAQIGDSSQVEKVTSNDQQALGDAGGAG